MATTMLLRDGIKDEMLEIENERDGSSKWIPVGSINSLIEDADVVTIFQEAKGAEEASWTTDYIKKLERFVLLKARRLFALLVWQKRVQLVDFFCCNDFGDDMFPIRLLRPDKGQKTDKQSKPKWTIESINNPTKTRKQISYRGHRVDDEDIDDICRFKQWHFFVPVFGENDPDYVFNPACHMPFLEELEPEKANETNFSVVRHFVIHSSHLKFTSNHEIVRNSFCLMSQAALS
jgi:hypothetical protein